MPQIPQDSVQSRQLARICRMETLLDEASEAMQQLEKAMAQYAAIQPKLKELANYYKSEAWMLDYESDENGQLPAELKRGVLSQDAVFPLLERQWEPEPVLGVWNREESDCG